MPQPSAPELISVQYLRGAAATMVVFHHALDQFPSFHALMPTSVGAAGVDLFFVISGFVMIYTTAANNYSAGAFLKRRAMRIVPLYWAMTALVAMLLYVAADLVNNSRFTLDSFVQSLLFIPHENPGLPGSITPMLKLGWTLNYEAFFYVCFAALIGLGPVLRTTALAGLFAALIALKALLSPDWAPLLFWADSIVFEFILGCVIGVLFLRSALTPPPWICIGLLGLACLALLTLGFKPALTLPRFIEFGIPCAIIAASFIALEQQAKAPWRNRLLRFLGDASYSIYLAHLYVVIAFRILWQRLQLPVEGWGPALLFVAACVCVGVMAGCATYLALERPLTDWARALVRRRRAAEA